ncbi:helix-turn-helix domain-containing protein [Microlunatus sp. GCM10028923]|uniref:helix-turn-helix domain-containing protein n=1 Tax=Microlunatus sp. GCM10028923 TaxID=3273400 RepID=UPI003613C4FB
MARLREQTEIGEGELVRALAVTLLRISDLMASDVLSLTRDELAQHLGVGRNTISKALDRLGPSLIEVGRTRIRLTDIDSLRRSARSSDNEM